MSNLQTLLELVTMNNGGREDAVATTIMKAAINYAAILAALVFEPPELRSNTNLTISSGSETVSFGSLTHLLDIVEVYNNTDSKRMWYIPFEQWRIILPASAGGVRFFSVWGEVIYVKDTPSGDKVLKLFYTEYPAPLVNLTDSLEFEWHDSYVVSVASAITMAAFEESDSAQLWQGVAQAVSTPLLLGARARQIIQGQKLTLEQAVQIAKAGEGQ